MCEMTAVFPNLIRDIFLYLGGRRTEPFQSSLLIHFVKTPCEKAGKTVYAAPEQPGNPQVTGIQVEIKFWI